MAVTSTTKCFSDIQEVYNYLRSICADVHVTKGDFDEQKSYAEDEVLCIGDFRIGLCHGHQVSEPATLTEIDSQSEAASPSGLAPG